MDRSKNIPRQYKSTRKRSNKTPKSTDEEMKFRNQRPSWSFWRVLKEDNWVVSQESLLHFDEYGEHHPNCIIKKLAEFETMTWNEIFQQTHDFKNKSSNHYIENIHRLDKRAQDRLNKLNLDSIFSLRLSNTRRIYGVLMSATLEILWYDEAHEIYPTDD